MYSVYILYSPKLDSFYRGQTSNLEIRVRQHNLRQEKSTRTGAPWTLLWSTSKGTRSDAIMLELKLKNLSRKRIIDFMSKYSEDIKGHDEVLRLQDLS